MQCKKNFRYETGNGISHQEEGHHNPQGPELGEQVVKGSYSYTGDDGQKITVKYTADANGFHAEGDHLPTPPPIPDEIAEYVFTRFNGIHTSLTFHVFVFSRSLKLTAPGYNPYDNNARSAAPTNNNNNYRPSPTNQGYPQQSTFPGPGSFRKSAGYGNQSPGLQASQASFSSRPAPKNTYLPPKHYSK